MRSEKSPLRHCVACCAEKPQNELIRIVKTKDGNVFVDRNGKGQGRGAYICRRNVCLNIHIKGKKLQKAFSSEINSGIYDEIKEIIDNSDIL